MTLARLIWPRLLTGLTALLMGLPLAAGQFESHDRIREAARQHILSKYSMVADEDINIQPAELDRRLRLTECDQPLESFAPASSNNGVRQTVGVSCSGKDSWTLYVTLKVEVKKSILVANRRLERGRIISKGDFRLEKRIVTGLHGGYIEIPEHALGSLSRITLKRGAVLSPGQLRRLPAVKRGSQVTILGRSGGIEVRMSGKALSDGSMGQRVKVINSSSSREIEGTVIARGTVEVIL